MGNPSFEDVSPIWNGGFSIAMLVYQRVHLQSFGVHCSCCRDYYILRLLGSQLLNVHFATRIASHPGRKKNNLNVQPHRLNKDGPTRKWIMGFLKLFHLRCVFFRIKEGFGGGKSDWKGWYISRGTLHNYPTFPFESGVRCLFWDWFLEHLSVPPL